MTQEEKAKAYDEALGRAKKIHSEIINNELIGFPGQIEYIFPVLRESESEDERIRKKIMDIVKASPFDEEKDVLLAWHEKQKEQKPAEWSEEDLRHKSWILECLADGERKMPTYAEDFRAAYKWLKSLRPSWKPSKEQMDALVYAYGLESDDIASVLKSLYEQLKKL